MARRSETRGTDMDMDTAVALLPYAIIFGLLLGGGAASLVAQWLQARRERRYRPKLWSGG